MFVRLTTITGENSTLDATVDFVEGTGRPRIEACEGNRGFATFTAAGTVVGASYWVDESAMRASLEVLGPLREQGAAVAGGRVSTEAYEMVVGFRRSIPARGATVRLARSQSDPARLDAGVATFRDDAAPRIKGAPGLCSVQLLVDRGSGRGMVATAWEDERAAEDFWPTASDLRAQATRRAGTTFAEVEVYSMVRTSVQLG